MNRLFEKEIFEETDYVVAYNLRKDINRRLNKLDVIKYKMSNEELMIRDNLKTLYSILDFYLDFCGLDYVDAANCIYDNNYDSEKLEYRYGRTEVNYFFNTIDGKYRSNSRKPIYNGAKEVCALMDVIRIILISNDLPSSESKEPSYKHLNMILENITPYLI